MNPEYLNLLQAGDIASYAWAISANVASQVLINMATPASRTAGLTPKSFQLKLCEGLTAALRLESDNQTREQLARYLCDDVTLREIATAFAKGDFSETNIIALVQRRIPGIDSASDIPEFLRIGISNLINHFNEFVADDSYLTSRALLEMGQQNHSVIQQTNSVGQQTHMEVQQLRQDLWNFTQLTARFTAPPDQATPQRSSVSTTSPQLSSISSFSQPFPLNTGSDFIKEDFERGLNELRNGSARKAKEIFTTVVERLEKIGIDNYRNLYFRAKSNLGISSYLCGNDIDLATTCLEEAFQYSDGSLKGRTNKALVCSLHGNDKQALVILNGILAETPDHFDALAQKADCLGRLGRKAEAISILRAIQTEDPEQKSVLGMTFCGLDDHEYVAITAKSILEKTPDDPWAKYMLAQSIAVPLIERFNEDKISSAFRTKADRDALQEAIKLLESALVAIRKSERPDMIAATFSNLCGYCCAAGDIKKSLKYAEEAMKIGNPHKSLHQNRFLAALLDGEFELALSSAEVLGAELPEQEAMTLKFECLRSLGRNKEALDILGAYKTRNPDALLSTRLRILEVEINLHVPDLEEAESLCSKLTADSPDDPFVWLTAANVAHDLGNTTEEEYLKKAISRSLQPGLRKEFLGMLGVYYGKQSKWLEALECFVPEGEGPLYNTPYLVEAATCYFNLGKHHQSLLLCTARLEKEYDPAACDLAIQSCLAMFELDKAKMFAERMAREDHINEPAGWGYLAHLEFRLGKPEEARKLLLGAIKRRTNEASLLILLSNVCLHLGRSKEALQFAFQALDVADDKNLLNAHRAVLAVGLGFEGDSSLETGDAQKIILSLNYLTSVDNSGLTAIPFEPDFAYLREVLRSQQVAAADGKRMFLEQGLPVYFLSHMSGLDIYDTWKVLTAGHGFHVIMALGSKEEQDTQLERASTCEGVVLDATALLTLRMLGLLSILPQIFKRVVVSYPTFEYFRNLIALSSFGPQSSGTIALDGDRFQMNEVETGSKEQEKREFLSPILEFLNSSSVERHGLVQPEQPNEVQYLFKTTSPQAFASLIVAKTTGLPLLCDDVGTLQIAKLGFDVEGFCSQAALRVGVTRRLIQQDEYADAIFLLFSSNYKFVSDDLDTLISYLSRNGWELTPLFKRLIERFDGGESNESASCRNMGSILAHAWMRTKSLTSGRELWMSYICERLRSRGSEEDNLRYALVGIATTFIEVPECYVALTQAMKEISWLPLSFRQSLSKISKIIVVMLSEDLGKKLGSAAMRWPVYFNNRFHASRQ